MDVEVCNGSSAPTQFEFDLPGMTVSLSGNDAFTTNSPGAEVDSSRNGCDVDICPVKGVVPAGGSVKCRVRKRDISYLRAWSEVSSKMSVQHHPLTWPTTYFCMQ